MYFVDYCGISELGRRLALVSKQGFKLVGRYALLFKRCCNVCANNYG